MTVASSLGTEPTPTCQCDDLRGDGMCLACASTPEDREETPVPTLAGWLLEQIDYDERVARAAVDPERPGTHWHWVTYETDRPVPPEDIAEALGDATLSLRTVEEFPTRSVGDLPSFLIHRVEEGLPGGLEHIAAWDPARVLAECEAKRRVVETWTERWREAEASERHNAMFASQATGLGVAVRVLAELYADRPGFREEWRG